MDIDPQPRRKVLKVLGTGAVVSTGAVVGLSQMSEPASASVALAFNDADVDLPEDKTIEDLRLTGEVTGDYNSGSEPVNSVTFLMNVDFGGFGGYSDNRRFGPDEDKGTVSWQPSHSLVEETDFDPSGDVISSNGRPNSSTSRVSFLSMSIAAYSQDHSPLILIAVSSTATRDGSAVGVSPTLLATR